MNIVSFSGGKDSTAMLIEMQRRGYEIDMVLFADTGLEFPETYQFIDQVEKKLGIEITRLKGKKSWDDMFYGTISRGPHKGKLRGFPPVNNIGWCTRVLKLDPMDKIQRGNDIYIGIAADEAHRVRPVDYNGYRRHYPLVDWDLSEARCMEICRENDLLNPLYDMGYKRLGCWCCPKQSIGDLRLLYNNHSDKWARLKEYEAASPWNMRPRDTLAELETRFKRENDYWNAQSVLTKW